MMVFRDAAAELEQLEGAAERDIGAEVGAGLATVNGGLFGLFRRIEREADRHAVTEGVVADRDADVRLAVHISEAAGDIADGAGGVRQRALEIGEPTNVGIGAGERLLAQRLRQDEAADSKVVEFRIGAIGMGDEMTADRHIDREIARPLIRGAAEFGQGVHPHRLGGDAARDARVDDINDAADRG